MLAATAPATACVTPSRLASASVHQSIRSLRDRISSRRRLPEPGFWRRATMEMRAWRAAARSIVTLAASAPATPQSSGAASLVVGAASLRCLPEPLKRLTEARRWSREGNADGRSRGANDRIVDADLSRALRDVERVEGALREERHVGP